MSVSFLLPAFPSLLASILVLGRLTILGGSRKGGDRGGPEKRARACGRTGEGRSRVATCAHANEKASLTTTDARTEADGQSETAKYSIEDAEPTKDVINL